MNHLNHYWNHENFIFAHRDEFDDIKRPQTYRIFTPNEVIEALSRGFTVYCLSGEGYVTYVI